MHPLSFPGLGVKSKYFETQGRPHSHTCRQRGPGPGGVGRPEGRGRTCRTGLRGREDASFARTANSKAAPTVLITVVC